MKRRELLRHLRANGCVLLREGANHSIYYNLANNATAPIPRHAEIDRALARSICKELGIPTP